jgi:hypothetical protein
LAKTQLTLGDEKKVRCRFFWLVGLIFGFAGVLELTFFDGGFTRTSDA